ncbi:FadR/GntR family transcriptional regulator [Serratia aquatilis]|uniref:FadR/GntR family transcriptional regulator n=1 Tax=Serratia aquatilis TaxID=1737515 RepID=A0ABV6EE51_9GAMM
MMTTTKSSKKYLYDELLGTLATKILKAEYPIGSQLPKEQELCLEYGLSRTSVREALHSLRNMGLVVSRPKAGTFVADRLQWKILDSLLLGLAAEAGIQLFKISELERFRRVIEPNVAAMAAESADAEDIKRMEEAVAIMMANCEDEQTSVYNEADLAFHHALIHATHNVIFVQLAPTMHTAVNSSIQITCPLDSPEERYKSAETHAQLIDAIRLRDTELCRYITTQMIFNSSQRALSLEKESRNRLITQS